MSAIDRQNSALQTIFSFFLGLMVVAFIGVGVNTFYPSPAEKYMKPRQELSQRQESLGRKAAPGTYTATERAQLDSLTAEQNALNDKVQALAKDWARVTSIILVLFATLTLAVSLVLNEQLRVISNGLLLGGLFTMVYGVGWVIFSGNSVARFWVILFALIVAIGLGYAKFVRGRRQKETAQQGAAVVVDDAALGALSARVAALEQRAAAAAQALAGNGGEG
jgi:hypothetical protein